MEKLAHPGDFYPNATCPDCRKLQNDQAQANLKIIIRETLAIKNSPQEALRRAI